MDCFHLDLDIYRNAVPYTDVLASTSTGAFTFTDLAVNTYYTVLAFVDLHASHDHVLDLSIQEPTGWYNGNTKAGAHG
jgi:hypothetical protein